METVDDKIKRDWQIRNSTLRIQKQTPRIWILGREADEIGFVFGYE